MINKKLIKSFCNRFNIKNYSINLDGSIDVYGLVNLDGYIDEELQIKFNIVSGYFFCSNSKINSFKNFPNFIGGEFHFKNNIIDNFYGFPVVEGKAILNESIIKSLDGYKDSIDKLIFEDKEKVIRKIKLTKLLNTIL